MKKIFQLMLTLMALIMVSCSTNDDPDNGEAVKPDAIVDDPTGTILLSMRNGNNGDTSLDGLRIGKDDNFTGGSDWMIASVGAVRGLGNVSSIPTSGWSGKVAVVPGTGYVAYNRYTDTYYRLFVVDYIQAAGSGGIIGADVKYQKPFRGEDQALKPDKSAVAFSGEGGTEQVIFENTSIIPFEVTSSQEWCTVRKASTRSESFLYDAITVTTEESLSAKDQTAEITIKTLYDKEVVITVTRKARGAFITPSQSEIGFFNYNHEQTEFISVFTNVDTSDINITTDSFWLNAKIEDKALAPVRRINFVDGRPQTRSLLENPVNKTLAITCQANGGESREGKITLSSGNVKAIVKVSQEGSGFRILANELNFDADKELKKEIGYHAGNLENYYIEFEYEDGCGEWLSAKVEDYRNISFTAKVNPDIKERSGKVKLVYNKPGYERLELAAVNVVQAGMKYEDMNLYFNRESQNLTLTYPLPEGTKVTSSESWCTATPSGETLIFRIGESDVNRSAIITFSGISAKIYVSQSKYKVGDVYSENGIEGRVCSMIEGAGIVYKLLGYAAWSAENVYLQDVSSPDNGVSNMEAVMKIPNWQSLYPAFAAVARLNNSWYFPAKDQLIVGSSVIQQYAGEDGYSDNACWSSTNYNVNTAYFCADGNTSTKHKDAKLLVAAFHDFSYNFNK